MKFSTVNAAAVGFMFAAFLTACATGWVSFKSAELYRAAGLKGPDTIRGMLSKPSGDGSFPAVVLLHGGFGIRAFQRDWARKIASWGYVTLLVDSYGPRGIRDKYEGRRVDLGADAWGGIEHLKTLQFVASDRIAVMGWSMGAVTALQISAKFVVREKHKQSLKAIIAFYPWCSMLTDFHAPVLIFAGVQDDSIDYKQCETLAQTVRGGGQPIRFVLYPDATHDFDCMDCGPRFLYNRAAHMDSVRQVKEFLATHLQ